jgi:hypothetical protein
MRKGLIAASATELPESQHWKNMEAITCCI